MASLFQELPSPSGYTNARYRELLMTQTGPLPRRISAISNLVFESRFATPYSPA